MTHGPLSVVRCQLLRIGYGGVVSDGVVVARTAFETLHVYRLAEKLADELWNLIVRWDRLAQDTTGKQLIRAVDSIGANIAEGSGRGSFQDNRRFVRIARGSLNETKHWLRRAFVRSLITAQQVETIKPMLDELAPRLNAYLKSIGPSKTKDALSSNGPRTTDH